VGIHAHRTDWQSARIEGPGLGGPHFPVRSGVTLMSRVDLWSELTHYVGFDDEDVEVLVQARSGLEPIFPDVVDAFSVAIEDSPRARAVFADGAQIERQKAMLAKWLVGLFAGSFDADYFESRARIGYAHVRIGLDPALMVAAMNVVRTELHRAVEEHLGGPEWRSTRRARLHRAIDRICDIDAAIMLETYRDDFAVRIRGAEKLAALGQIAGTIGHELRNPFAVMETSLHLLRSHLPEDPKTQKHLDRLDAQVVLCTNIVRDLMDLARDRAPSRETVSVVEVVGDALGSLPGSEGIVTVFTPDDPVANVDRLQLRQLVVNLVTNALQASKSGGPGVTVNLTATDEDLTVVVEDDGDGIAPEAWERLFEPLFTTRMRGVGFGLALCRRIAEGHSGLIRASNREQGGARFEATLRFVSHSGA